MWPDCLLLLEKTLPCRFHHWYFSVAQAIPRAANLGLACASGVFAKVIDQDGKLPEPAVEKADRRVEHRFAI